MRGSDMNMEVSMEEIKRHWYQRGSGRAAGVTQEPYAESGEMDSVLEQFLM
jgi:hypothetical protein